MKDIVKITPWFLADFELIESLANKQLNFDGVEDIVPLTGNPDLDNRIVEVLEERNPEIAWGLKYRCLNDSDPNSAYTYLTMDIK